VERVIAVTSLTSDISPSNPPNAGLQSFRISTSPCDTIPFVHRSQGQPHPMCKVNRVRSQRIFTWRARTSYDQTDVADLSMHRCATPNPASSHVFPCPGSMRRGEASRCRISHARRWNGYQQAVSAACTSPNMIENPLRWGIGE
jgi:hypothetical protein